jgi:hypothetical protein
VIAGEVLLRGRVGFLKSEMALAERLLRTLAKDTDTVQVPFG